MKVFCPECFAAYGSRMPLAYITVQTFWPCPLFCILFLQFVSHVMTTANENEIAKYVVDLNFKTVQIHKDVVVY